MNAVRGIELNPNIASPGQFGNRATNMLIEFIDLISGQLDRLKRTTEIYCQNGSGKLISVDFNRRLYGKTLIVEPNIQSINIRSHYFKIPYTLQKSAEAGNFGCSFVLNKPFIGYMEIISQYFFEGRNGTDFAP